MENKNQSAFPVFLQEGLSSNSHVDIGLTKREHFAAMAMQGILAGGRSWTSDSDAVAKDAVIYADKLLKQLEQK